MEATVAFVLRHGLEFVFLLVFAEQIGLPLPATPVLLAAGALAAGGHLGLGATLAVAVAAAVVADSCWYELGRRRGRAILALLCRVSLEPDSCVRRTQNIFARRGAAALLYAKFVPGLNTAAPPLAGLFGMRWWRFLAWDGAGAALWVGSAVLLGYFFSHQLGEIAELAAGVGHTVAILGGALLLYLGGKLWQRRRFLRQIEVARITPEELKRKLDAGEDLVVVDLRSSPDFEVDAATLPGALRLLPDEIEARFRELPTDREVVLYCT